MDQQQQQPSLPTPPPLTATTTTTNPPGPTTYPDSLDSSPRSRKTDSWDETNNNPTMTAPPQQPPPPAKLRLMCSYGGHIVPRPHDKSLCYIGGDTRIVVVDRHTSLTDLTSRLSKTLIRSSSSPYPFALKYQLPSEDLDSLISVTTDEDLENMIDEYERLINGDVSNTSSRLRLFLFPVKPESVTSIGSLLENSTKSEDWFLNALNGTTSGFSDTSSVNCLLGLEEPGPVNDGKKDVLVKAPKGGQGQDVHSVPDLERTSSFGSASSSPSLASLPPIRVHVEDGNKAGGIEEQFAQMNVVVPVNPAVVSGVPVAAPVELVQQYQHKFDLTSPDSVSSDGMGRNKPAVMYQDPLVQIQANSNVNRPSDLNSNSSNVSDQSARVQMQQQQQQQQMADSAYLMSMSNTQADPQHTQMQQQQQQQQMADSAYLMSMSNTQADPQHTQTHHQQPQFIHTAVPQPQYIHHHPSGAVPMASYYQMYPSQSQHRPGHHPAMDQQNFVYYMPARQAPHGYNMQMQQPATGYAEVSSGTNTPLAHNQAPPSGYTTTRTTQTVPKSELPAGVYGTTNSGGSQFVQVPTSQHQPQVQPQPQYVGYSQMHHPSQSVASSVSSAGANYGYEFADPAQGQHIYYAAQPVPPQSTAQYQTVTGETGSYLPTESSTKQQQGRTQQS